MEESIETFREVLVEHLENLTQETHGEKFGIILGGMHVQIPGENLGGTIGPYF